jgi:hypothetical protein
MKNKVQGRLSLSLSSTKMVLWLNSPSFSLDPVVTRSIKSIVAHARMDAGSQDGHPEGEDEDADCFKLNKSTVRRETRSRMGTRRET